MGDMDSALPHQPGYRLPCECASCTRWNNDQTGLIMTCTEKRCVCDEPVNLEVFRVSSVGDEAISWLAYYRCARGLCGYNLKAFSPDFGKHSRIIDHARNYLVSQRKVRCGCGNLASYGISYVAELESLQLFFICRDKRCSMKHSMLDVVTRKNRGVRCMCVGTNLQVRQTCVLIDGFYRCPNADDPNKNCGFSCHRKDSLTFIHCKQTETDLEDSPYQAFPRRPKTLVCSKPGRLKFKYNKDYTNGQLGYVCDDKKCDIFIKDILWVY